MNTKDPLRKYSAAYYRLQDPAIRQEAKTLAIDAILSIPYTEIDGVPLVIRQEVIEAIERKL